MEYLASLQIPETLWNFRDELGWLAVGAILAGVVRGFSGFGTAMVFLPFASSVVQPVWALIILCIMDIIGPTLMSPKMARNANAGELVRLTIGAAVAMPFGIALLEMLSHGMFRYTVSLLTLCLVAVMASGWRYHGTSSNMAVFGIGGLGGLLAGATGLPGPPVMLFYLARPLPTASIRANIFIYLILADLLLLAMLSIRGWLSPEPVYAGFAIALIYLAALGIGSLLFRPGREGEYRIAAYAIIGGSAVLGLINPIG